MAKQCTNVKFNDLWIVDWINVYVCRWTLRSFNCTEKENTAPMKNKHFTQHYENIWLLHRNVILSFSVIVVSCNLCLFKMWFIIPFKYCWKYRIKSEQKKIIFYIPATDSWYVNTIFCCILLLTEAQIAANIDVKSVYSSNGNNANKTI